MFNKFAFLTCVFLCVVSGLSAQAIPKSAVVLEKRRVTANRQMILWMPAPKKNPRAAAGEIYTCPEETRGSYYSGAARVSLVDLKTRKLINTIEIRGSYATENNMIDLPYRIHRGYYAVPRLDKFKEGAPVLMNLKDYNGDGKALEFALFDAIACMGLPSTLIGYSEKQDRVMQYEAELQNDGGAAKSFWVDYLFGRKPDKEGVWRYEIDYRGRGGTLDRYEFRYDRKRELFYGTLKSVADAEEKSDK